MAYDNDKRRRLLGRLSRRLSCAAPVLALAAWGMSLEATMDDERGATGLDRLSCLRAPGVSRAQFLGTPQSGAG